MTKEEPKFALLVEEALNRIPEPEYRQLIVEACKRFVEHGRYDNAGGAGENHQQVRQQGEGGVLGTGEGHGEGRWGFGLRARGRVVRLGAGGDSRLRFARAAHAGNGAGTGDFKGTASLFGVGILPQSADKRLIARIWKRCAVEVNC